jgi:hypothetical protein
MSYQLSYWDVVKTIFIPDPELYFIYLVFIIAFLFLINKMGWRQARWHIFIMSTIAVIALLGGALINKGAGWILYDNKLEIKGASISESINISEDKMILVEADSLWKPVTRLHGFNSPGLYTGKFKLANKQEAMVFCHMPYSKIVVFQVKDHSVLLGYPGVEELYNYILSTREGGTDDL